MKAVNKGFTLIELMIVVAIIAVLAAIAVPAYQNYIGKSQFAAGLAQVGALKTPTEMFIVDNGNFPTANASGSSFSIPEYDNGVVTTGTASTDGSGSLIFTFNKGTAGINTENITLIRESNGGWKCTTSVEKTEFVQGCTITP